MLDWLLLVQRLSLTGAWRFCACATDVMQTHKSLCPFWQLQLVAEYDCRARKELHFLHTEPVSM